MASTGTGGTLPPNFLLTPQQQTLLFAALNSNKQQASGSAANNTLPFSPTSFQNDPVQRKRIQSAGPQESPYLDNYDYDFGDSSFDFSFATDDQPSMIGDLPSSTPATTSANFDSADLDAAEKRSHPDDESDDSSPGADPKRREGTEKVPKKPGRKPLTSEPSSVCLFISTLASHRPTNLMTKKRKAQNRAAQRAFRERKERHLKDLEDKVEELEKASQAANHENTILRNQVELMTSQLNQYKQKVTLMTTSKALPREKVPFGSAAVSNLGDVNFQFEFPKFGMLPGPPARQQQAHNSPTTSPQQQQTLNQSPSGSLTSDRKPSQSQFNDDLAKFSGVFSPSMSSSATNPSRTSVDSANFSNNGATSSPSASSQSNNGPSSSCGTSPEPFTQSPMGFKPLETLTTIGEEQTSVSSGGVTGQNSNVDLNNSNFDWLAQQNGGQFDPQLFGGYREPQESILANPSFDDFFNDALDVDFFTPYNMAPSPNTAANVAAVANVNHDTVNSNNNSHKKNLIDEIDAQKETYDDEPLKRDDMNCNQLW